MGNRGMVLQQIDFALQVNLNDLSIQRCPRKMAGATFPEKQMKHDAVKGRVLRVPMTVPVGYVHIQFDISFDQLFSVQAE